MQIILISVRSSYAFAQQKSIDFYSCCLVHLNTSSIQFKMLENGILMKSTFIILACCLLLCLLNPLTRSDFLLSRSEWLVCVACTAGPCLKIPLLLDSPIAVLLGSAISWPINEAAFHWFHRQEKQYKLSIKNNALTLKSEETDFTLRLKQYWQRICQCAFMLLILFDGKGWI